MLKVIKIIAMAIVGAFLSGCERKSPTVVFNIPNNFRGVIAVIPNQTNGNPWLETNGVYDLRIPTNGLVRMKSWGPLAQWHKERALFQNGTAIPNGNPNAKDTVFFFQLAAMLDPGAWYFVGTQSERDSLGGSDQIRSMLTNRLDSSLGKQGH